MLKKISISNWITVNAIIIIVWFLVMLVLLRKTYAGSFKITLITDTNEHGAVTIDWSTYDYVDKVFKVYTLREGGTQYETVGLDYKTVTEVKVLQVYPISNASNQLKTWMETNGYGKGIIKVDSVSIEDYNNNPNAYLKDSDGNYKYQVIFFGTWDSNNNKDLSGASAAATLEFIKHGYGCILGHDTIYYSAHPNFNQIAPYADIDVVTSWPNSAVTKVQIVKKGLFTTYPWEIGEIGTVLTIPAAHTLTQYAKGDIWLKFVGGDPYGPNNNFYLTTHNNVAMIQTGHSSGAATEDEQKILANLIFYTNQLLFGQATLRDNSGQDVAAPNKPTITLDGGKFNFSATDNSTKYYYYVESYSKNDTTETGLIDTSNTENVEVETGIRNYKYIYDNNANTVVTYANGTELNDNSMDINRNYRYLHVAAVDNAGNISETSSIYIDKVYNYTINYNLQNVDGNGYTANKVVKEATIEGTEITPEIVTYTGFTSPEITPTKITKNEQIINLNYTRNKYKVELEKDSGINATLGGGTYYYDASVSINAEIRQGYTWRGWEGTTKYSKTENTFNMPAQNIQEKATTIINTYNLEYDLNEPDPTTSKATIEENPSAYNVETETFILNNPKRIGYDFIGWTEQIIDSNGQVISNETKPTVTIEKGSINNRKYIANWQVRNDTKYKVNYYLQNIYNAENEDITKEYNLETSKNTKYYTLQETSDLQGKTDASVQPKVKKYEGFTSPQPETITIKGDGTTELNYWYKRNIYNYTISYNLQNVDGKGYTTDKVIKGIAVAGAEITPEIVTYTGFTSPEIAPTKITKNEQVINLNYTRNKYEVELEKDNGINETFGGGTHYYGALVNINAEINEGYTWEGWEGTTKYSKTENTFNMPAQNIQEKATTIINTYNLEYDLNDPAPTTSKATIEENPSTYNVETETFILNNPKRAGYDFIGWTEQIIDSNEQVISDETKPTVTIEKGSINNRKYIANWQVRNDTKYKVNYYLQNIYNAESEEITKKYNLETSKNAKYYILQETSELQGTADMSIQPEVKKYEGFTSPKPETIIIKGDGTTELNYWYKRNIYKYIINYNLQNVDGKGYTTDKVIKGIAVAENKIRPGILTYTGFTLPEVLPIEITQNEQIINLNYTRNKYKVELEKDEGISKVKGEGTYRYGEKIEINAELKEGYEFIKWEGTYTDEHQKIKVTMPANEIKLKAFTAKIREQPLPKTGEDRIQKIIGITTIGMIIVISVLAIAIKKIDKK